MSDFLNTCFAVQKIIKNDCVLMDQNYQSFELADGYRVEAWRNDPAVDLELKRKFRSLLNRSAIYHKEDFEWESDFRMIFQEKELSAKGCLLAYENEGVAVSFLSREEWKQKEIKGSYIFLCDNGDLEEKEVQVSNVSYGYNVEAFKEYYEQKKDEKRYTEINSSEDILNQAEEMFPNLVFCENAISGCRKNVGVSEAGQVYKRLLELQRAAEKLEQKFEKEMLLHATPETKATLEKYQDEHTFLLPEGEAREFSWHIRYTGSYGGRIFFYPVPEEKKIYIGHVGHKLPTVKYSH